MAKMNEIYSIQVVCANCGHRRELEIRRGIALLNTECPNCGCLRMEQRHGPAQA